MKIFLLGYGKRHGVRETVARLRPEIARLAEIVVEDLSGKMDLSEYDADAALVFGGDGSILRAVRQMGTRQIPVLAINLGRLGFMADVSPDELLPLLKKLAAQIARMGDAWKLGADMKHHAGAEQDADAFTISRHLLLHCEVRPAKPRGPAGEETFSQLAMNEVAVLSGAPFTILELKVYADAELVTTYTCDGLILSTPIGSTAHSLSAGGPILRQDLEAVVISPISPHTLTHRPVVDSARRVYRFELARARSHASVVVDGSVLCRLEAGDVLTVRESDVRYVRINVPGYSYYSTLREKLGWSGQMKFENGGR